MREFVNRWTFTCTLLGAGLALLILSLELSAKTIPFCRFSLQDGWTDEEPSEYITRKARRDDESGVPQVVRKIKRALSISADFDVYIAEHEDNAFATVANGRKLLIVDVGFLEKLNQIARTQWSAIQVISHEIGHHIAGFSEDRHRAELNADYWSGQTLQRLGSSRSAATSGILAFGTEFDLPSHPNKRRRAAAIVKGWDDARKGVIDYSFCDDCR